MLAIARRHIHVILAAAAVLTLPAPADAMSFEPTEAEWAGWPEYCQARYTVSAAGRNSPFANRVDPSLARVWESRLGREVWYGFHHYCGGLVIGARAKARSNKHDRELDLRHAIGEMNYTLTRITQPSPMRAEIAARKGMLHRDLGESDKAMQHAEMAIRDCTECSIGYQTKAMLQRQAGELTQARETLETANRATNGESAEIHYFLGLLLLDLEDFSSAQQHARKAYELGYPLPGLRDRLAKAGHPLN